MLKHHWCCLALAWLAGGTASAAILQEDFSKDPAQAGWKVFGDTNLFTWQETQQALAVTWDSSKTNSYFYRPLGAVVSRDDDFYLEFDLRLLDIAPSTKSGPFQIAVGLIHFAEASNPEFWRGSGVNATHGPRNVVEFDYFPAGYYPGWGDVAPSISPTIVSSNNAFAAQFAFLELTNNGLYHISLKFDAAASSLSTSVTSGGASLGQIADVVLGAQFTDFNVDTVAVCSYSDIGNEFDSVLAHALIDNLAVRLPPRLTPTRADGLAQIQFLSHTNLMYSLESTTDFISWSPVGEPVRGTGTTMVLTDTNGAPNRVLYRVRASSE